ncbi:MAG: SpoIIE family protein phosphatase [Coriobacteriia bacterium]|nr:SpoIIE family protein phosphatase [Coriobacteriia bacterium]
MVKRARIAWKLAAIYMVVAVPLVTILAVVYRQWYDTRVAQVEQERLGVARLAGTAFELLVKDMLGTAGALGQSQVARDPGSPESVQALQRFQEAYPVRYAAVTDPRGRVLSSSGTVPEGEDLSGDPAFGACLRSASGEGIEPSARHEHDGVGFHLARRIDDADGDTVGVMMVLVDVTALPEALEDVVGMERGGMSIIDSRGRLVFQNEDPGLARRLEDWTPRHPSVESAIRGETVVLRHWSGPTPSGEERVAAFVPIERLGWAAGASVPHREALGPFYRSLLVGLPLTAAVVGLALLASVLLSSSIRRSLTVVADDARRIGSGELGRPVRSERTDEIGDVARSLEDARTSLRSHVEGLTRLGEVGRELAGATEADVVKRAVAQGARSLFDPVAVWVYVFEEGGAPTAPYLWDVPGRTVPKELASFRLSPDEGATGRVMRTGEEALIADASHDECVLDGELARYLGFRSLAVLPLGSKGRRFGVLGIAFREEDARESGRALQLLRAFAGQVAVAIDNVRLFESERERSARLSTLRDVASLVTSSLDSKAVVERALESVIRHLGVTAASVWMLQGRRRLALVGGLGFPPAFFEDFADGVALDEPYEVVRAIREGNMVVHEDAATSDVSTRVRDAYRRYGIELGSLVVVPLLAKEETIGSLTLAWPRPRIFGEEERAFVASLADTFTTGLQNASLFERAQEAARLGDALNLVDDLVHSTLRPEEVFSEVLEVAATSIGCDSSALDLVEDGAWVPTHIWHLPAEILGRRFEPRDVPFVDIAAATKAPVAVEDALHDPRTSREVQERYNIPSVVVAPLTRRERVEGALFFNYHSPHRFSQGEVDFARKVASSVSLALENARLYENERHVSETLQETLLALPESIHGLEFAPLYHSATEMARVGGDFYDLFELGHGLVGVTVGDISGKGIDAAVLTSLVKNTIRAHAAEREGNPAEVLRLADDVLYRWSPPEIFATVFFGVIRPDGRLLYCNAGHTTAALVCRGGVERLEADSPLIGALPDVEFRESETGMAEDDLLFLYTDGLIEARSADGELYGEERLFELLAHMGGVSAAEAVRRAADEVLAFGGGRLTDDLAVLAIRPRPAG